jgi:hypothetical protein
LADAGELSVPAHAAIAMDAVIQLRFPELETRDNSHLRMVGLNWHSFGAVCEKMLGSDSDTLREYGDVKNAPNVLLHSSARGPISEEAFMMGLLWDEACDDILAAANFRLSWLNRRLHTVESWIDQKWVHFPRILKLLAALASLIGVFLLGRLSHSLDSSAPDKSQAEQSGGPSPK